jgi:hypothetical protein
MHGVIEVSIGMIVRLGLPPIIVLLAIEDAGQRPVISSKDFIRVRPIDFHDTIITNIFLPGHPSGKAMPPGFRLWRR